MSDVFVGWDVGAWNCDKNSQKNRDAVVALEVRKAKEPELLGYAWRGNVRSQMSGTWSLIAVRDLLELANVTQRKSDRVTIAIGVPLAWPSATVKLLAARGKRAGTSRVPDDATANPYLFRRQEIALSGGVDKPISAVRDVVGSQSTKAIHFLRAADLKPKSPGVWTSSDRTVTAIETSVSLATARSPRLVELTKKLYNEQRNWDDSNAFESDVSDAITCALVAWLWRTQPELLEPPDYGASKEEGWIWLPPAPVVVVEDDDDDGKKKKKKKKG